MRKLFIILLVQLISWNVMAQKPLITNIDPASTFPGSRMTINGSGFGNNIANVVVWYGAAKGTVVSVTDNFLVVTVPIGASADNVTVINKASGRSSQSKERFYPVYSGDGFNSSLLTNPVAIADTRQVYDPCSCDLDGDGLPEVISTKFENATDLLLLINQSTVESFGFTKSSIDIGHPTVNIRCGDLNGDGKPDLYMSRGGSSRFNVFVLENTSTVGNISFGPLQTLPMNTDVITRRVTHRDLNGDGKPEIVVTNSASGQIIAFENTSSGSISYNSTPIVIPVPGATSTAGIDIQDFDKDGKADLIVGQFFGNNVYVLRNIGVGSSIEFAAPQVLTLTGNSLLNLVSGDFNANGKVDFAIIGNATSKIFIYANTSTPGSISFASPQSIDVNANPWGLAAGDLDGDGLLDLVITSVNQNEMTALINNTPTSGALSFSKQNIALGKKSRNVSINDLDGDGKPDLAVTASEGNTSFDVRLMRNKNCYQPQILNNGPLAICSGQTLTLLTPASPSAIFTWTLNGVPVAGNGNNLDITAPGTYEVTAVSEAASCSAQASISVADGNGTVPGNPTASNSGPACIGGSVTLSANTVSGATYSWRGPNNFSSTVQSPVISNLTNDNAGIYSVTIKVGDCNSSESETIVDIITQPDFGVTATGGTEICAGNSTTLSTQLLAGYTYQWYKDGSAISGATNNTYSATQSGVYGVVVDDTNSNCEITTNEVEINVYTMPVVDFTMEPVGCTGVEFVFTNNSTIDNTATVIYDWDFGNGALSAERAPVYTYTSAGNYTVQLVIQYPGIVGCSGNKSKGLSVKNPIIPEIQALETSICPGSELDLTIQDTFSDILWSTNETISNITINEAGIYSVETIDANGCASYSAIEISEYAVPNVQATADKEEIIIGEQVQLNATGANSYTWMPDVSLSDANISNPIAQPAVTTTYVVTGTNSEGCSATDEILITIKAGGGVDISPLKAFSPNSTINPTWEIQNVENYPECTLSIFDERGTLVFREKGYANTWMGTNEGKPLPKGVYYYVFGCEGLNPKTGSVLLVR